MEMPKGWESLYVRGRVIEGHDCDDILVMEALDLMKEMAWALERVSQEEFPDKFSTWERYKEILNDPLQKFKGWK